MVELTENQTNRINDYGSVRINLASPEDINTAMELGLNYPRGSIALAEDLGADVCLEVLQGLQDITGEDRYRPSLWLKRRAMLGLSLHTPN